MLTYHCDLQLHSLTFTNSCSHSHKHSHIRLSLRLFRDSKFESYEIQAIYGPIYIIHVLVGPMHTPMYNTTSDNVFSTLYLLGLLY